MVTAKSTKTDDAQAKTNEKTGHTQNPVDSVSAITPQPNPANCHCEITGQPKKDWWDNTKPFVELAGIVLLGVYTFYTIKMYSANKNAADAATKAANVAAAQARPVLWLTNNFGQPQYFAAPSNQITWEIHFKNYGPTPANEVIWSDVSMKIGVNGEWKPSYRVDVPPEPKINHPIAPTEEVRRTGVSDPGISQQQLATLTQVDFAISVRGTVAYKDASGQSFETGFCLTRLKLGGITFCEGNYIH